MMFLAAESRWVISSLWHKWALLSWKNNDVRSVNQVVSHWVVSH